MTYLRHLFVFCKYHIVTQFRDFGETLFSGFYFSDLSVLYFTILYKPQCYSRIPSPEKSCNNTLKKYNNFSRVWYRNQLLTRHLLLAPVGQDDEWMAKPSPFFIQGCLLEFFHSMAVKHLEICMAYGKWSSNFPKGGGGQKSKIQFFFYNCKNSTQINTQVIKYP